jgi:RHS repeat-associated protein
MSPATLVRFGRVARSSLPFGDAWYETGTADKWKFTGYERDSGAGETGLDYANFRYYASGQGRFMSADLMSGQLLSPQSLNRYSYTMGDPVNFSDPLGLDPCATPSDGCYRVTTNRPYLNDDGGGGGAGRHIDPTLAPSEDGNGGGGGGDTADQRRKNCDKGLKLANADSNAIDRANDIWDILQAAADANNVDPALLAAITVRETGARNIPEQGGGQGRGYFQIDLGAHPKVTEAQAFDPTFAANYAAKLLDSNMDKIAAAHPNLNPAQLLQATAASYNFGTGNISGNPNTIDVGTTGNNYGINILLLMDCF